MIVQQMGRSTELLAEKLRTVTEIELRLADEAGSPSLRWSRDRRTNDG